MIEMRIMATSDLHGNLEGLDPRGADVVVLAGDIAPLPESATPGGATPSETGSN